MATVTEPTTTTPANTRPRPAEQLPSLRGPRLPYHPAIQERFGIDKASWKALVEAVFPNATTTESIVLALSYCRARKLDPFKRNVHIVPIWNRDQKCYVDTIWPGIGELRTTAFRTGEYAGRGQTEFGPDVTKKIGSIEITFPEWAQVTVHRMVKGLRVEFVGPRVYWEETYGETKRDDATPNDMWRNRPRGQIDKCAEAAALRAAFPEECGGDCVADEVQHVGTQTVDAVSFEAAPAGLDELATKLESEGNSEKSTETEETAAGDMPSWDRYCKEIASCDVIGGLTIIYDRYFGPDVTIEWTPEENAEATKVRDARAAELRAARTAKSGGKVS